jgi:hypothetical protein
MEVFTKWRFSIQLELLSGHEKIITKSGISLNAGTLNRGFTVLSKYMNGFSHLLPSCLCSVKLSSQECSSSSISYTTMVI